MEVLGLESPWPGTDITYALSSIVARFNKLEDSLNGEDTGFVGSFSYSYFWYYAYAKLLGRRLAVCSMYGYAPTFTESKWIKLLQTASPLGFNYTIFTIRVIFLKCQISMCFRFWSFERVNLDFMVKGKKEMTNVKDELLKSNTRTSLNNLSPKLRERGQSYAF